MFDTAEQLKEAIEKYINNPPTKTVIINGNAIEIPHLTVTRMAYELGFTSRSSLYEYKEDQRFTDIIKRACLYIESNYEAMLHNPGCTGAIFALKNMGWSDKHDLISSDGSMSPKSFNDFYSKD